MKKLIVASALASILSVGSVNASWWGNDDPWDDNDWPVFTPMYWMEEMFDEWDDNDWDWRGYGPYGYGAPYGYGVPYAPYGYGMPPAPYAAPPAYYPYSTGYPAAPAAPTAPAQ